MCFKEKSSVSTSQVSVNITATCCVAELLGLLLRTPDFYRLDRLLGQLSEVTSVCFRVFLPPMALL